MEKVFIVYYDNGMSWEDHRTYVDRVYANRHNADVYAKEKNDSQQDDEDSYGEKPRWYVVEKDLY